MENPFEIIINRLTNIENLLIEIQGKTKEVIIDEELIGRLEACELLKINSTTLWRWQKEGRINVYKFCKKSYYKRNELLDSIIKVKI
jgi:hypothetical protein